MTPRTLCVCGQTWLAHGPGRCILDLLSRPRVADSKFVNSANAGSSEPNALATQQFTTWQPPQQPTAEASTNDRRVEAMIRHRCVNQVVSSGSVSSSRTRTTRLKAGSSNTQANQLALPQPYSFDIGIIANPVCISFSPVKPADMIPVVANCWTRPERILLDLNLGGPPS
jgi:hypothetical protein